MKFNIAYTIVVDKPHVDVYVWCCSDAVPERERDGRRIITKIKHKDFAFAKTA